MKNEIKFGYTILRYVYDIATQEFVNVGVLVYSPESRGLKLQTSREISRLKALFPDMKNQAAFKALMSHVQNAFDAYSNQLSGKAIDSIPEGIMATATHILPKDSSALQWSSPAGGLTLDLEAKSKELFQRFVTRHGKKTPVVKTSLNVLRPFRKTLRDKQVWDRIGKVTVEGMLSKFTFDYSWKNGLYHCYQPIVFDQKTSLGIQSKVHEWLGLVRDLHQSGTQHRIYLLAGAPQMSSLKREYREATQAMTKLLEHKAKIVPEEEIPAFSEEVASNILKHAA